MTFFEKAELLKNQLNTTQEDAINIANECAIEKATKRIKEELNLFQKYGYKKSEATRFFVYIAKDKHVDGLYKIGKSSNLPERIKRGTTDNPFIQYIYFKELKSSREMDDLEEEIHNLLASCNFKNFIPKDEYLASQEWFFLTNNVVKSVVSKYSFSA